MFIKPLFTVQKKCIRIMFGDTEAYLDKFKTCARSKEFCSQKLGTEFYEKEASKPLFSENELLTVHNLHKYHSILETFKILKFRRPISMYGIFNISQRKEDLLITPLPSKNFTYTAASLWNNCIVISQVQWILLHR